MFNISCVLFENLKDKPKLLCLTKTYRKNILGQEFQIYIIINPTCSVITFASKTRSILQF